MGPTTAPDVSATVRRRRTLAAVGLGVLALHAAVLVALTPARPAPGAAPPLPRAVVALRPAPSPPPGTAAVALAARGAPPARVAAAAPAHGDPGARRPAESRPSTVPAQAPPTAAGPAVVQPRAAGASVGPTTMLESAGPDAVTRATATDLAVAPMAGDARIPVYPTRLPPSLRLRFEVQRGGSIGRAELVWLRQDDGYELSLAGDLLGRPILQAASRGGIDADGLAPVRHVERRRMRDVRAVNFQRDAGIVTFSGPQVEHPLVAGAQDRLSWLIQLPAIVAAAPDALGVPGAQVTILVVGTRGDAEAWRFDAESREAVGAPEGSAADALRFVRQPSRPYDRRVEVWLDPRRGWLPVRLRFTPVPGGDATELRLQEVEPAG